MRLNYREDVQVLVEIDGPTRLKTLGQYHPHQGCGGQSGSQQDAVQGPTRSRNRALRKRERGSQTVTQWAGNHDNLMLLQRLQLLARLESHRFAGRYRDLRSGPRVAPDAGLARAHVEDPKSAQLDAFTMRKCPLHAFKNSFHRHLGFGFRNSGLVHYFIDYVELDHLCLPSE